VVRVIGDGVVIAIAGPYGAGPHKLDLVLAPPTGYRSLCGHLLEQPPLENSQRIDHGGPVGSIGVRGGSGRDQAPHLHLESGDETMRRASNPVHSIEAD